LWVKNFVPETKLNLVPLHKEVEVSIDAPQRTFKGKIHQSDIRPELTVQFDGLLCGRSGADNLKIRLRLEGRHKPFADGGMVIDHEYTDMLTTVHRVCLFHWEQSLRCWCLPPGCF